MQTTVALGIFTAIVFPTISGHGKMWGFKGLQYFILDWRTSRSSGEAQELFWGNCNMWIYLLNHSTFHTKMDYESVCKQIYTMLSSRNFFATEPQSWVASYVSLVLYI